MVKQRSVQPHLWDMISIMHPEVKYSLTAFLGMMDYRKWLIQRALKARKGEKHSTKRRKR